MRRLVVRMLAGALLAAGCANVDDGKMAAKTPFYDRPGGKRANAAVVDDCVGNVAAGARSAG